MVVWFGWGEVMNGWYWTWRIHLAGFLCFLPGGGGGGGRDKTGWITTILFL